MSTVLAAVRDGASGKIAADARSVDRERASPVAGLHALAEAGALGLAVPKSAGGAELVQVERLRAGELDACLLANWTLKGLRADGREAAVEIAWPSLPFHHCNFTALDSGTADHEAFRALLLRMDATDPALREAMRLESVNRWVDGDEPVYADLIEAVRWRGS